ncbi:MAG: MiaB/RimO family radical SAM methylthiotransferase [Gemmatimonadaceae bacterium]|nr:MiaB/RimO family radical SAM methylthiotransferase [Gemmatimonadaceae bacterium]
MKVYIETYGCRANHYDSETVRAMVVRGGGTVVASSDDADVAVFNSCTVTAEAERDLRKGIRRAQRTGRPLQTLVMGCMSSGADAGLARLGVDHLMPGADFPRIAEALALPASSLGTASTQQGARALLRIQDGCDAHCTFCATTLARGANRSRPAADLVTEATELALHHPEIVLTGVHIGTWGHDLGASLGDLVAQLVAEVPRVRFRLSSIEATEVDATLAELLQNPDRVAPHLHAPLQSGSDAILRRMGRHWYSADTYARAITRIVAGRGTFGLGADLIAGFPGETEADHAATVALVRDLPFTYLHVFPWSPRPGTAAERLSGRVDVACAQERALELRELGAERRAAYSISRDGTDADVVAVRGDRPEGLTGDYLAVRLEGARLPRGSRARMRLQATASGLVASSLVPSVA